MANIVTDFNTISEELTNVVIGLNDAADGIENGMDNFATLQNYLPNVVTGLRIAAAGIEKAAKQIFTLKHFIPEDLSEQLQLLDQKITAGRDEIIAEVKRREVNTMSRIFNAQLNTPNELLRPLLNVNGGLIHNFPMTANDVTRLDGEAMDTLCLELGLRADETYEEKLAKLRDTIGIIGY